MSTSTLTAALFAIDGEERFAGLHDPSVRWNGWACPTFPFAEAQRIAKWYDDENAVHGTSSLTYDEPRDAFVLRIGKEEEPYTPTLIDGVKHYAIGSHSWVWDDYPADGDRAEFPHYGVMPEADAVIAATPLTTQSSTSTGVPMPHTIALATYAPTVVMGDQYVDAEQYLKIAGHKVRVRIRSDSYASQSYAYAEVFHPSELKWNRVYSIPHQRMQTPTKLAYLPNMSGLRQANFQGDIAALIAGATAILT